MHVITNVRVQIQRQVIGQQADVMLEQGFQAALLHAGNARVFAFPEITVVHQYQVGLGFDGGVQQGLACGHAADDAHHLRATLDLQAIGAIIGNFCAAEIAVRFLDQGAKGHGHKRLLNIPFRGAHSLV